MKKIESDAAGLLEDFSFDQYRFKRVEVRADRMTYRGVFLGADDKTLYLKGNLRYLLLPMDLVQSVRLGDEEQGLDPKKSIGAEFYQEDEGPGEDDTDSP